MENTFEIVKRIITNLFKIDNEDILLKSALRDDLLIDSLDIVELIMNIEMEFDISIPDNVDFHSVIDIVDYVNDILKSRESDESK
jgi:acyl carrier protein